MTAVQTVARRDSDLRADLGAAGDMLAKVTLVGALSGALAVGVLGRLAMLLLAYLNPLATGVTSDDGFEMGQFTLSGSLQLVASGLQFGVIGVFFYLAVRGLMVGPGWFRLLSISLGPAVVIGAILVHTDGVDFNLLEPVWLAAVALHRRAGRLLRAAARPRRPGAPLGAAAPARPAGPGPAPVAPSTAAHPAPPRRLPRPCARCVAARRGVTSSPGRGRAGSSGAPSPRSSCSRSWTWSVTSRS